MDMSPIQANEQETDQKSGSPDEKQIESQEDSKVKEEKSDSEIKKEDKKA